MREGWKCPACKRINSPDLDNCPCSGGGASVRVTTVYPGTGGGSATIDVPVSTTIAPMTTGGGSLSVITGTTGTAWEGVTITTTNAA